MKPTGTGQLEPVLGSAAVLAHLGAISVHPAHVVARQVVLDGPDGRPYAFRDVALVAWHAAEDGRWRHDELVLASIDCPDGASIRCHVQVDADTRDPADDAAPPAASSSGRGGSGDGEGHGGMSWRLVKAVVIEPAEADSLIEHLWPHWIARMPQMLRRSRLLTTGRPLLFAAVGPRSTHAPVPAPPAVTEASVHAALREDLRRFRQRIAEYRSGGATVDVRQIQGEFRRLQARFGRLHGKRPVSARRETTS